MVKVPISCPCVDGIRRSLSTIYTVRAADTVDSISEGYGGLVSAEQIRSVNSINVKNPSDDWAEPCDSIAMHLLRQQQQWRNSSVYVICGADWGEFKQHWSRVWHHWKNLT
ncbi:hypothetical protein F0562_025178 [Nyssa sinensis]|uniref:LysM domain-containing protein n=1 Tax=Nyssa sinensis TaxID=561372 RepID=A0A5J5BDJ3_9ASTE|nr:hypothetical protein F0562_025178 [Nyssa sinensis]